MKMKFRRYFVLALSILAVSFLTVQGVLAEEVSPKTSQINTFQQIKNEIQHIQSEVQREIPKYMKATKKAENPWPTMVALLFAFVYGVLHTLGPGHGKTVISTYFLTKESSYIKGIAMSCYFSVAHVIGAIVLVGVADISLKTLMFSPDEQIFWVKVISYSGILVVGLLMLFNGMKHFFSKNHHHHGCAHCAHHEKKGGKFLFISAGLLPCTGSLLILLYAMSQNMLWLGVAMVVFVAIGMAITMICIGFASIFAQNFYSKRWVSGKGSSHAIKVSIEILGALVLVAFSGIFLFATLA